MMDDKAMLCDMVGCSEPATRRLIVTLADGSAQWRHDYCAPHGEYAKLLVEGVAVAPLTTSLTFLA